MVCEFGFSNKFTICGLGHFPKVHFLMVLLRASGLSRGANELRLGISFLSWVRLENVFGAFVLLVVAPMPELSTFDCE